MPVLSVLERLWYYLSFTQLSLWHLCVELEEYSSLLTSWGFKGED